MSKYQVFDTLDDATYAALRESIELRGVIVPVLIDQHGDIVDGHNRAAIAEELGISYPKHTVTVHDDDDGRDVARVVGTVRRHLDPDQRRPMVAELRKSGHSLRAIAAATGVTKSQVERDIDTLSRGGQDADPPSKVKGTDGRTFSAKPNNDTIPGIKADEIDAALGQLRMDGDSSAGRDFREAFGSSRKLPKTRWDESQAWLADRLEMLTKAAGGSAEEAADRETAANGAPSSAPPGEPQERATADAGPDDPAATTTAGAARSTAPPRSPGRSEKQDAAKVARAGQMALDCATLAAALKGHGSAADFEAGYWLASTDEKARIRADVERAFNLVWQLHELTKQAAA